MAIRVKAAETAGEKDAVYKLRYRVFIEEEGKFQNDSFPDKKMLDKFDASDSTISAILLDGDMPIGTVRVSVDSSDGLPADKLYDFGSYRKDNDGPFAGIGMLAILKEYRNYDNFMVLYRFLLQAVALKGIEWILFPLNLEIQPILIRHGAEIIGEPVYIEQIGSSIVPMRQNIPAAVKRMKVFEHYKNLGAYDTLERIICLPNECIFTKGDNEGAIYYLTRGSAIVHRETEHSVVPQSMERLDPGDFIGELSVITGKPLSVTVVAGEQGLELAKITSQALFDFAKAETFNRMIIVSLANRLYRRVGENSMAEVVAHNIGHEYAQST